MQRTNFGELACSIARTLDVIGEPWSPLILRDVWVGMHRFDQLLGDLGISRKVLTLMPYASLSASSRSFWEGARRPKMMSLRMRR